MYVSVDFRQGFFIAILIEVEFSKQIPLYALKCEILF